MPTQHYEKNAQLIDKLMKKATEEPEFGKRLRQHPKQTIESLGISVDKATEELINSVNWQANANEIGKDLKQRVSKAPSPPAKP